MAKRAEGVTERLLRAAREEFMEKGYERASLRLIAKRARSSKGAIYVRYPDKAALMVAVVDPAIEGLCSFLCGAFGDFEKLPVEAQRSDMNAYADEGMGLMMDYLYDHAAEFKILLGSGVEHYEYLMVRIINMNNASTYRYIDAVGNDALSAGRLTPELMSLISRAFYSGVLECLARDMTRSEAKAHVERLCAFFRAGWLAIFNPELLPLAAAPVAPVSSSGPAAAPGAYGAGGAPDAPAAAGSPDAPAAQGAAPLPGSPGAAGATSAFGVVDRRESPEGLFGDRPHGTCARPGAPRAGAP